MNTDLSKATAAPVEFDCRGKKVMLHPLRHCDWGLIEQWMRTKIIDAAKNVLKQDPDLDSAFRMDIMQSAYREAECISVSDCFLKPKEKNSRTSAFMRTAEGWLRVVHLALRDKSGKDGKPIYTLEEVDEMIGPDVDLLTDMYGAVFKVSFPEENPVDEGESEKNQPAAEQPSQ